MDIDLYAFFNLSDECTTKDIKHAYKSKARELHPDKNKDNPLAKEQFQQLKEYYEILHDPVRRKEYDAKWKAKREAQKRHEALDENRRKLKEKLEAQEAKAKAEREQQRRASATTAAADQIRREWQKRNEQIELEARLARKRLLEEQKQQLQAQFCSKAPRSGGAIVRVKWVVTTDKAQIAACYTKDFLKTCLSEYGEVVALTIGKKGTAMAEFASLSGAEKAVAASEHGEVGIPNSPLRLTLVSEENPHPSDWSEKPEPSPQQTSFESFESDILSRMANFTN
ncbi:unnamed protein product [Calicophoron daubneyi]|uniref:J domain-containing protein n=1 Tax=Calicophoron daubneyi TaxID=300641 RepID=A0AAV2TYQ4_CALDB